MRELDVRSALHDQLKTLFSEHEGALAIDEFGLCQGLARIDVALIDGEIHGFEIKSDSDNLDRLPGQISIYNKVLDTVTIVTGESHLSQILSLVPEWWGIIVARMEGESISLFNMREPLNNPEIDPFSLVELLWHDEALAILESHNLDKGVRSKSRKYLWNVLASQIPMNDLSTTIRSTLKNRVSLKKRNCLLID